MRSWAATPQGRIWVDAAYVWAVTRVIFLMLTYLVPNLLLRTPGGAGVGITGPLEQWVTQDGFHFTYIAQHGYYPLWRTAFWPGFPLLAHLFGPVFGGDYGLAGIFASNAAFFGALVALRRLVERELGAEVARRTILYLAIFPTAFYFFAPYSESLFLFLSVCAFAAMRERRWWLAGLLGCLAALTRSSGMMLVAPFAVEFFLAWRQRKARWWQAAWVALIPMAPVIFTAYLYLQHRDPLAWLHSQSYWGRQLD
jgi:Gpi18-like mannosyltransferase